MVYEPLVERSDRSDVVCGRDEPVEADTAYRHAEQEEVAAMKLSRQTILFWLPRGLGLLFAGFLGLFALDVFGAGYGFWETAVALLMHLIPTIVLLIVLGLSWRWPWIGAIGFMGFAIWYV